MNRLRDEPVLLALCQKVHDYLGRVGDTGSQSKVALRLVEHLYFKHQVGGVGGCWGMLYSWVGCVCVCAGLWVRARGL
jgi:hypothetical protein